MISSDIKLFLQPDVVFDSESNGCNFSSLAPPGGEKKIIFFFFKMTSLVGVGVFIRYHRDVILYKKLEIIFSRHQVALES